MADPKLQGLNYETPLTLNDLSHLEKVYTDEFVRRIQAIMASYRIAGASFGILSEFETIEASAFSDPFFVEQNAVDGMTVDVHPGTAVAENGMLTLLTTKVESLAMVNQEVGQQNVVFVEYVVISDDDTLTKTRFNTREARQIVRAPDTSTDPLALRTLQVASMEDWLDNTLFPPDRREGITPIALVSIISKTTTPFKEIDVDLARTTLTVNRPWFSPVDIAHRALVGTGSSTVPHNLGLNDLSQGNLTLYDQLLNHGMVLGRDEDAPGVPGKLCFETITPTRVKIDNNGSVTGQIGQRYVELVRFPVRLLGALSIPNNDNEIAVELIPHSNILTIHQNEFLPDQGFRVQYSSVSAGEPLVDSLVSDEIHFEQPETDKELIISGGRGWDEVEPNFIDVFNNTRGRISLGTSASIPKRYQILLDANGQLLFTPQHILCGTKLDDVGTGVFAFTTTMLGAARIRVGLQNVDLSASTVIRLRIAGTDNLGAAVTEDLTFDFLTYESPALGDCDENTKNFQVTNTVFSAVTSMTVLERTSDGPSSAVIVYADLDPLQTTAIRDACPLAEVMWDGVSICRIRDIRPISSRLELSGRTTPVKLVSQTITASLALNGHTEIFEVLGEDLRDPYKLRLQDPLRFHKFADGLRSTILPEHPGEELTDNGLDEDIYLSQALRLPLTGTTRFVHIALVGIDAQQFWLNGIDGIAPQLEYRVTSTIDPDTWGPWTVESSLSNANGTNFRIELGDSDYKLQLRVKGSVAGIAAVQYTSVAPIDSMIEVERLSDLTITTQVAVPWLTTIIQDTGSYTLVSTEITILETGRHKISYSADLSAPTDAVVRGQIDLDTGGGFSIISRSISHSDMSINSAEQGSIYNSVTINANVGDKVRLFVGKISGASAATMESGMFRVEKVG